MPALFRISLTLIPSALRAASSSAGWAGFFSSRSADRLREDLKRPLPRTVIRRVEGKIRRQHSYQRNVGKIMPFGYHLRADKNLRFFPGKRFQNFAVAFLRLSGVGVHTQYLYAGKCLLKQRNNLLSADSTLSETFLVAVGTLCQHVVLFAAIVTFQQIFLSVYRQTYIAVGTFCHIPALSTHKEGRVPPSVEENHCLIALVQSFFQFLQK